MQSGKMCWGRIKEGHPDCWFHCDADLRMAGCVRGTRVDSVCEDWLNKATDEAIVSVGTWCACLTGMWWLPVIGCHCGKLLARDITSCGVWHIMSHLIESWDCAVDRNIIRISRCCYISKLFLQLTWHLCSLQALTSILQTWMYHLCHRPFCFYLFTISRDDSTHLLACEDILQAVKWDLHHWGHIWTVFLFPVTLTGVLRSCLVQALNVGVQGRKSWLQH